MATVLRMVRPDDAAQLVEIVAPIILESAISLHYEVPTPSQMRAAVERALASDPWMVIERSGAILGHAYGNVYRSSPGTRWGCETSIAIRDGARGRGLGRALYTALLEVLRVQGYCNVFASIVQPNPASVRLHQSVGFDEVGRFRRAGWKLGCWHDSIWFQRALSDGPPAPLLAMETLQQQPECIAALRRLD